MYTLIAPTTAVLPSYRFGILRPAQPTVNTAGPSRNRALRPGAPTRRSRIIVTMAMRRAFRLGLLFVIGAFLLIQLIPYGHDHANPPVGAEPAWDSPATRELAAAACFDCHSNETEWPLYTSVAPFSWLTQHDVEEGRATLNFSEWDRPQETDEVTEAIREGSMPPWYYRLLHPAARLSDAELERLIAGLEETFRASPPG